MSETEKPETIFDRIAANAATNPKARQYLERRAERQAARAAMANAKTRAKANSGGKNDDDELPDMAIATTAPNFTPSPIDTLATKTNPILEEIGRNLAASGKHLEFTQPSTKVPVKEKSDVQIMTPEKQYAQQRMNESKTTGNPLSPEKQFAQRKLSEWESKQHKSSVILTAPQNVDIQNPLRKQRDIIE